MRHRPTIGLTILVVLAWLVIHPSSLGASERNVAPDKMMPRVAWSFAEPAPASTDDLIKQLDAYASSIKRKVNKRELGRVFPGKQLDIQYNYGVQRPSGHWDTIHVVVRVKERGKPLTFAEILLQLHEASHQHLKNDDHRYFEGLYLLDRPFEKGVPAYEVYLGS